MIKTLLIVLMFLIQVTLSEKLYVLPETGEYGLEDGSDYTNAFDGFSGVSFGAGTGSVSAGDTLFVGGGVYAPTLDITVSCVVIKASPSNHGTETGWVESYGSDIALIDSVSGVVTNGIQIASGINDVIIDGSYKYGLKIQTANIGNDKAISVPYTKRTLFKNIEICGPAPSSDEFDYNGSSNRGFYFYSALTSDSITISNCSIHNIGQGVTYLCKNLTIEYSLLYNFRAITGDDLHDDVIYSHGQSDSLIFRYNKVSNWRTECLYWAGPDEAHVVGAFVYGNVFSKSSQGGTGRILESDQAKYDGGSVSGLVFVSNTIDSVWQVVSQSAGNSMTGISKNNILTNVYGSLSWEDVTASNNSENTLTQSIYLDAANSDYHLSENVGTYEYIADEYDTDMDGVDRTSSLGSFEYVSGTSTNRKCVIWAY